MTNDHCSSAEEEEGEWEKEDRLRTLTGCLGDGANECECRSIDRVSVIEVGCGERSMKHCALVHVMLMARTKRETFDRMRQPTIDVIDEVLFDLKMQYRDIIYSFEGIEENIQRFDKLLFTWSGIHQIARERWIQIAAMRMIRKTVLRLTVSNRSAFKNKRTKKSWLRKCILVRFAVNWASGAYLAFPTLPTTPEKCDTWLRMSSAMLWFSIGYIRGRGIDRPLYADTWSQSCERKKRTRRNFVQH